MGGALQARQSTPLKERDCQDKAPIESFFASVKKGRTPCEDYRTPAEAQASIFEYLKVYNIRVTAAPG
jgi:hypothetical protein